MTPTMCQQSGFTAPSTPRGSAVQNQNCSAPSTPSSCLARQQTMMATGSQTSDINRLPDTYLPSSVPNSGMIQHNDQKTVGYGFAPSTMGNTARQQENVTGLSGYDYADRRSGVMTPSGQRTDIVTPLPPSGNMMNVSQKREVTGPLTPSGSMSHCQDLSTAYMSSDSISRLQDQMIPFTTSGTMGYHSDYMPPYVSSGSSGRHLDMMDPMNLSSSDVRNQQLAHPSVRSQMSDSLFLTRSSSGRCLSRDDDIINHYEHTGLDLDVSYHDNALLSRRQNNERLVHSLPTSPRKIMQPSSVHSNVMSPLYIGNSNMGGYSNSDYNLEKTNKSKVLPKEVSVFSQVTLCKNTLIRCRNEYAMAAYSVMAIYLTGKAQYSVFD
jgi:hypothetical protein